jgi:hypothetical protein
MTFHICNHLLHFTDCPLSRDKKIIIIIIIILIKINTRWRFGEKIGPRLQAKTIKLRPTQLEPIGKTTLILWARG